MKKLQAILTVCLVPILLFAVVSLSENQPLTNVPYYVSIAAALLASALLFLIPKLRAALLDSLRASLTRQGPVGPVVFWSIAGVMGLGWVMILAGIFAAAAVDSNAWMDRSLPQTHAATVQKTETSRTQRSGTHYYAIVLSWRPGHEPEHLQIPKGLYKEVTPGRSRLEIITGRGRWNWDYVRDVRLLKEQTPKLGNNIVH